MIPSLQLAAHALAEARQVGDRSRETTALIDLAVAYLHKLEAQPAASLLEEALAEARQLGERARELDALSNSPRQLLMLGPTARGDRACSGRRSRRFARPATVISEKVALERQGHAQQGLGRPRRGPEPVRTGAGDRPPPGRCPA